MSACHSLLIRFDLIWFIECTIKGCCMPYTFFFFDLIQSKCSNESSYLFLWRLLKPLTVYQIDNVFLFYLVSAHYFEWAGKLLSQNSKHHWVFRKLRLCRVNKTSDKTSVISCIWILIILSSGFTLLKSIYISRQIVSRFWVVEGIRLHISIWLTVE